MNSWMVGSPADVEAAAEQSPRLDIKQPRNFGDKGSGLCRFRDDHKLTSVRVCMLIQSS